MIYRPHRLDLVWSRRPRWSDHLLIGAIYFALYGALSLGIVVLAITMVQAIDRTVVLEGRR